MKYSFRLYISFFLLALAIAALPSPAADQATYDSLDIRHTDLTGETFIRNWLICGPFPKSEDSQASAPVYQGHGGYGPPPAIRIDDTNTEIQINSRPVESRSELFEVRAFDADYLTEHGGESDIQPSIGMTHHYRNKEITWRAITSEKDVLDLWRTYDNQENATAYAYAEVVSDASKQIFLSVGSDDAVKVWLNGELVHEIWTDREARPDSEYVRVTLQPGVNGLLFKIVNGMRDWGVVARVMDSDHMVQMQQQIVQKETRQERRVRDVAQMATLITQLGIFIFIILVVIVIQRIVSKRGE